MDQTKLDGCEREQVEGKRECEGSYASLRIVCALTSTDVVYSASSMASFVVVPFLTSALCFSAALSRDNLKSITQIKDQQPISATIILPSRPSYSLIVNLHILHPRYFSCSTVLHSQHSVRSWRSVSTYPVLGSQSQSMASR